MNKRRRKKALDRAAQKLLDAVFGHLDSLPPAERVKRLAAFEAKVAEINARRASVH